MTSSKYSPPPIMVLDKDQLTVDETYFLWLLDHPDTDSSSDGETWLLALIFIMGPDPARTALRGLLARGILRVRCEHNEGYAPQIWVRRG